jgi:DNA-binding transcriptional LysR family regulator
MERGSVPIALGEGFVGDFVQTALSRFSKDHPKITFSLDVGATNDVTSAVIQDQAHVGLAFNAQSDPRLKIVAQTQRNLAVICSKGGAFDTSEDVRIDELSQLPFGFLSKGYGVGSVIADMEATHGFRARAVLETGSIAALKAFVRNDLRVTLMPEFVVAEDINAGRLCARRVAVADFGVGTVSLIVRQGRSLPVAVQKLLPIMSRSLVSLNG